MTTPSRFEKMRANRRHWGDSVASRRGRLLEKIDALEREESATWRAELDQLRDPFQVIASAPPLRRRLFGWLAGRDAVEE